LRRQARAIPGDVFVHHAVAQHQNTGAGKGGECGAQVHGTSILPKTHRTQHVNTGKSARRADQAAAAGAPRPRRTAAPAYCDKRRANASNSGSSDFFLFTASARGTRVSRLTAKPTILPVSPEMAARTTCTH